MKTHLNYIGNTVLLGDNNAALYTLEDLAEFYFSDKKILEQTEILSKVNIKRLANEPDFSIFTTNKENTKYLYVDLAGSRVAFFKSEHDFISMGLVKCAKCSSFKKQDSFFLDTNDGKIFCSACAKGFKACDICGKKHAALGRKSLEDKTVDVCSACVFDILACSACNKYHLHKCPNQDMSRMVGCNISEPIKPVGMITKDLPVYIGMELEISTHDVTGVIAGFRKHYPGLFWGVSDGSVDGVEIVSQPMSFSQWKKIKIDWPINGGNENCGIHLHICRSPHRHDQLLDILNLFWNNKNDIYKVAERDQNNYSQIRSLDTYKSCKNLTYFIGGDKYSALNFCNIKTLEYRIFKSFTDDHKIHKNIEFAFALYDWSNRGGNTANFSDFKNFIQKEKDKYNHLTAFLERVF